MKSRKHIIISTSNVMQHATHHRHKHPAKPLNP